MYWMYLNDLVDTKITGRSVAEFIFWRTERLLISEEKYDRLPPIELEFEWLYR